MTELWKRRPVEQAPGTPSLTEAEAADLDGELDPAWSRDGTAQLRREWTFRTFADAFTLATRLALLAETCQHHPILEVSWGRLVVLFTTDSIGGLSENDYIMAARIDRLD